MSPPPPPHPLVVSARTLRQSIGLLALLLPVLLGAGGLFVGVPLQPSLSAYVHTPLRDLFVGPLAAIAVLFFCYRGHDRFEDLTANLACVFALGLAFFPLDADAEPPFSRTPAGLVHVVAGGGFFLTLAVYSLLHFPRRPAADDPDPRRREPQRVGRNRLYRLSGAVILVSMAGMAVYLLLLPAGPRAAADRYRTLFWLESLAVWAFAAAWLIKGRILFSDTALRLLAHAERRLRGDADLTGPNSGHRP